MHWQLSFGQHAARIARAALEEGREVPDSCIPPEVDEELVPYLRHFWELSTERAAAFSTLLPIPWSSIDQYAKQYGYADDEIDYDDFVTIIRALDETFLNEIRKTPAPKKDKK